MLLSLSLRLALARSASGHDQSQIYKLKSAISAFLLLPLLNPPLDVALLAGAHRKRSGWDVLTDGGAGSDVRVFPDGNRCDELRIAADESALLDCRLLFRHPVIVAGDRPGANVDVGANLCITQVCQVHRLRAGAQTGSFDLDKVADLHPGLDSCLVAKMGERADAHILVHSHLAQEAAIQDDDPSADSRVDDPDAAVQLAAGADARVPLDRHARVDDCVRPNLDLFVNVGCGRIVNGDARRHQRTVLSVPHDPAHLRQLETAVDSGNFLGLRHSHSLHSSAASAVDGHEVRKVVLALRVFGSDPPDAVEQPIKCKGVNSRVDFVDRTLGGAGILLLHNLCNLLAVSDNPAISGGVIDDSGQDCCRRAP